MEPKSKYLLLLFAVCIIALVGLYVFTYDIPEDYGNGHTTCIDVDGSCSINPELPDHIKYEIKELVEASQNGT
jgi:hypothetical protein